MTMEKKIKILVIVSIVTLIFLGYSFITSDKIATLKPSNDCREYTIYPFKDRPSSSTGDFGIYIHSTNEPIGCGAIISYELQSTDNTFIIDLGKTSYSGVCPDAVGLEEGHAPNARIILGSLNTGEYKINVKNCDIIDKYILSVEDNRLVLKIINSRYGQLHPNNKGVFEW